MAGLGLFLLLEGPGIELLHNKHLNLGLSSSFQGSMQALALSTTPSSSRRPPRIRPKRQSPSSDEASYGSESNNNSQTKDNDKSKGSSSSSSSSKHQEALQDPSLLTGIRFEDRADLHPHTKEALLKGFGIESMTVVQASTYEAALEGRSVLAKSKTGSGKTLAFLLPTMERLLGDETFLVGRSIGCVVLAPTRELAIQIADQAEILVGYHNKHRPAKPLKVACIYGGVKMQRDVRLLSGDRGGTRDLPTILVATPSRLLEHLGGSSTLFKKTRSNDIQVSSSRRKRKPKSQFETVLAQTKIVVLDETDRLLQKSNIKETQSVLASLARKEKRQTLLFSATFPRAVRRLLSNSSILSKTKKGDYDDDFLEVDCYRKEESRKGGKGSILVESGAKPTNESESKRIQESFVVLQNMSQFIPSLLTIIRREQQRDSQNYKILVFFPAGRLVRFLFQFFTIGGLEKRGNLWEIHSRMSQSSRTRASSSFRAARRGILFSSDVSARGLDYPDVSLVVQMGAPSSDQDYIHRIGRTGRAGKAGRGLLVLLPFETRSEQTPKCRDRESYRTDANVEEDLELASWIRQPENSESLYQMSKRNLEPTLSKVRSGHVVLTPGAQASYKTFLAHYIPTPNRKTKSGNNKAKPSEILSHAQDFIKGTGLAHVPKLDDEFASKLGLPSQDP